MDYTVEVKVRATAPWGRRVVLDRAYRVSSEAEEDALRVAAANAANDFPTATVEAVEARLSSSYNPPESFA